MSTLSSTMVNAAKSLDEEISSLTDSSIKLRKALLELQRNVAIVDSYTQSGLELKWKAIRSKYDVLLHALNETAKLCADTIGDYVVLLPEIGNPDMFEDAQIELNALIGACLQSNQKLKRDNSDKGLSDNFNRLGDSIVHFVSEIDAVIMHKDQEVNSNSNKAKEQVSSAKDEVARLEEEKAEKERQCQRFENPDYDRAAVESAYRSSIELADAKKRLGSAQEAMGQANEDAQAHARQNTSLNWPFIRTSLSNAKVQLGIVASGHLAIDKARKILTAEVEGHLKAFNGFSLERTQSNQLALANYNRKALDNKPKLVRIQNSLEKFAFEFK